ncbi:MAG: hypothetical protein JW844_03540 [Candidatus Omnitrophica bacterium]|nr:hypothetical protein [Candidatus Omnitrophota bacterium]
MCEYTPLQQLLLQGFCFPARQDASINQVVQLAFWNPFRKRERADDLASTQEALIGYGKKRGP